MVSLVLLSSEGEITVKSCFLVVLGHVVLNPHVKIVTQVFYEAAVDTAGRLVSCTAGP